VNYLGQRYDIIINANQTVDNYWFRVAIGACNTNSITSSGVQMGAILSYAGAGPGNPTSTTNVVARTTCNDEDPSNLVPFVPNSVPTSIVPSAVELDVNIKQDASTNNLFRWTVNGVAQRIDWSTPTLQTELSGSSDFGSTSNTYLMSTKSQWYLWYIENKVCRSESSIYPARRLLGKCYSSAACLMIFNL
jgi:hypothetical protein